MAITAHLHTRLLAVLTRRGYKEADWLISSNRHDGKAPGTELLIRYAFDDGFYLRAVIPKERVKPSKEAYEPDFVIPMVFSPGEASVEEKATVHGVDQLLTAILSWAERVDRELTSGPVARQLAEQQAKIEELLSRIIDAEKVGDSFFTRQEAEAFQTRITQLEEELVAAVEQQQLDAKEMQAAIAEIHREMEDLREAATKLKKKSVARKVASWAVGVATPAITKALGMGGIEVIHRLLPPP